MNKAMHRPRPVSPLPDIYQGIEWLQLTDELLHFQYLLMENFVVGFLLAEGLTP